MQPCRPPGPITVIASIFSFLLAEGKVNGRLSLQKGVFLSLGIKHTQILLYYKRCRLHGQPQDPEELYIIVFNTSSGCICN
jgi:hypothetical protein